MRRNSKERAKRLEAMYRRFEELDKISEEIKRRFKELDKMREENNKRCEVLTKNMKRLRETVQRHREAVFSESCTDELTTDAPSLMLGSEPEDSDLTAWQLSGEKRGLEDSERGSYHSDSTRENKKMRR